MTLWAQLTDAEREALVLDVIAGLEEAGVPLHLRAGLVRYFSDGILPGSFLQAVLCNNLEQAVLRADPFSAFGLECLVRFLDACAPKGSWGSRENVLAWTTTPDRLEV